MISIFILLLTVFFPRIYNYSNKDLQFKNLDSLGYLFIVFFFLCILLNIALSKMNPGYLENQNK